MAASYSRSISTRNRSRSNSFAGEITEADKFGARIKDLFDRNNKLVKKTALNELKLMYKRDVQITRLNEMIQTTIDKMKQLVLEGQKAIFAAAESSLDELPSLRQACSNQRFELEELFHYSASFPGYEISARLDKVEAEMAKMDKWLDTCANFGCMIDPELSQLCKAVMECEKPVFIQKSDIPASNVRLWYAPHTGFLGAVTKTVTIVADPIKSVPDLDKSLEATLERSDQRASGDGEEPKLCVQGVIMPLTDGSGRVKITFPRVPVGGDYTINVYVRGLPVCNSPMSISLADETRFGASMTPQNRHFKPISTQGDKELEMPTASGATTTSATSVISVTNTPLSYLAERARHRSGAAPGKSVSRCRNVSASSVAVASKRLSTPGAGPNGINGGTPTAA